MADVNIATNAELTIGPAAIKNYSRMSYTMWHALAEFIDNSTQSRLNYDSIIDAALAAEGVPLIVEIDYNALKREFTIKDNSIGMNRDDLINALKIAQPTIDSKGRSKYGMGMKTAACWIGNHWKIETAELTSGEEWTATVDVNAIATTGTTTVPLTVRSVGKDEHYTHVTIWDLNRNLQKRTEENIRTYLSSIYRYDLASGRLKILYRGESIQPPDNFNFDTDPDGKPMKRDIPETKINGKTVKGFIGVLKPGSGGRKYGGFSLFQHNRQIQGFPTAWKPRNIFGGVDEEGANNLIAQRLTGLIELDEKFKVSHTKDAILFEGDEEEDLENFLEKFSKDYREYARKRRGDAAGTPWNREKFKELISDLTSEFVTGELKDAINTSILPPLEAITASNLKLVQGLDPSDKIATFQVTPSLRVEVWLRETSDYEPYVTLAPAGEVGTIHIVINRLHPYYAGLESSDTVQECVRQYIYDAIAEHQVIHQTSKINPDSVRRLKDSLLRATVLKIDNQSAPQSDASSTTDSVASAKG